MLPSATNVLGQLKAKKWPRLRHLDMRFLTTTVADFQAFVAPHTGTLKTFRLYAQLLEGEKEQRDCLLHWIRTGVCPQEGGAEFRHFLWKLDEWAIGGGYNEEVEDSE